MIPLIQKLFNESDIKHIESLISDNSDIISIHKEIGIRLIGSDAIIPELPFDQLLVILSVSPFANNSEECHDVANIITWGIHEKDILPSVVDQHHKPKELAYRCLISLSFFKSTLIHKHDRYGAPSPEFYRGIGINSFKQVGMDVISQHFLQWENFINDVFI